MAFVPFPGSSQTGAAQVAHVENRAVHDLKGLVNYKSIFLRRSTASGLILVKPVRNRLRPASGRTTGSGR